MDWYLFGVFVVIICNDMVLFEDEELIMVFYMFFGCVLIDKGYWVFVNYFV